jgi:predicted transcriptional regulator
LAKRVDSQCGTLLPSSSGIRFAGLKPELHMKVEQLMTPSPATCGPTENLPQAVKRMWDANCGIIPVVDDLGHVVGVVSAMRAIYAPPLPTAQRAA